MSISIELWIAIVSGIATIISTYFAFQQSRKVQVLRKQKHKLTWDDMEIGINHLFKNIENDFKADVVVCLSERGTAIVTMGFAIFGRNLPIVTAFWQDPQKKPLDLSNMGFLELKSRKRSFYLPDTVLKFTEKRILIIDDWAFSGESMKCIHDILRQHKVPEENMMFAALVTSPAAKAAIEPIVNKFHFYFEFPDSDFYFPWGKAT